MQAPKTTLYNLQALTMNTTIKPLKPCTPNKGYMRVRGVWRYNSTNLHARINRRVGLQNK